MLVLVLVLVVDALVLLKHHLGFVALMVIELRDMNVVFAAFQAEPPHLGVVPVSSVLFIFFVSST